MPIRPYEPTDLPAVSRIWKECGWVESDEEAANIEHLFADATGLVATMDDDAECSGTAHQGVISYDGIDLPLAAITSITTSRLGRKQGFGQAITARLLAKSAQSGAAVALLGMFEQGFYDRVGFGTGPYVIHYRFDPASLTVEVPARVPVRLDISAWAEIAETVRNRQRSHGGVALDSKILMKAELAWNTPPVGLGYRDVDGRLTHFVWGKTKGEEGPYQIDWFVYENPSQLLELFGLLKSLGDQVRAIDLMEPAGVQIQDLIRHPNRQRIVTKGTDYQVGGRAHAWWQIRILDLAACIAARSHPGAPVSFNLELSDPLSNLGTEWPGVGGSFIVEIAESSTVRPGTKPEHPTLRASVNAFTRMWIGVRPASGLAITDEFEAPAALLKRLDEAFRLPHPHTGMYL